MADNCRLRDDRSLVALLVGLVLLAGVPSLFARDLWSGEETAFLEVSREMVLLRDPLVQRLNGEPSEPRPPLPFWLAGILWTAGAGHNSGRILSILAVLGTLLAVYVAVAGRVGRQAALSAAAITLTSMVVFWHVRQGLPVPLGIFLVTAALLSGHGALHAEGRAATARWLCCYGMLSMALLADGLLGPLATGAILLLYSMANRKHVKAGGAAHLLGVCLLAALTLSWVALASRAGGGWHAVATALTRSLADLWRALARTDPLRTVAGTLFELLPWIIIMPVAVAGAVRQHRQGGEPGPFFAALWLLVLAAPLLLVGSAGIDFRLLAAPPIGILCGWFFASPSVERLGLAKAGRRLTAAALAIAALFTGAVLTVGIMHLADVSYLLVGKHHVCPVTDQPYSVSRLAAALPLVALPFGLLVVGLFRSSANLVRRALLLSSAVLLLGLPMDLFLTPFLDSYKSPREFALQVLGQTHGAAAVYQFPSEFGGKYNLYTGYVRMPVVRTRKELQESLREPGAFVIADEKRLKRALEPGKWEHRVQAQGRVAGRSMVLLRGAGSGPAP